jgi:multimeric flavodoxin WrbA
MSSSVRLLGLSGSPRDGSTALAVRTALEYASSLGDVTTEFVSLKGKTINPCLHCDYCVRKKKGCIQKDDVQDIFPLMTETDGWILGTPVYQGSLSAQLKAVLDRCRAVVASDPAAFRNKVGASIAVGGDRSGGQEPAIMAIHAFYMANEMIPVGGGPFGANLGGTVWSKDKGAEGARSDEEGLKTVRKTVKRLVSVCRVVKEGSR